MRKLTFILLFIGLALQAQDRITTATPFLLINTDARAGGMGDIGVATSSDAFAIFHNPAKIAFNKNKVSMGINYTPWLRNLTDDIFVGDASYINRFQENSAWGVNIKYFSLGQIDLTDINGVSAGSENPNEFAITGVYSLKLSEQLSMGIGLKYINSNLDFNDNLNAVNSFGVDVSAYYQSTEENYGNFNGRYRIGINVTNIGPKVSYDNNATDNFIPTNLKLGGGFDFILDDYNILGINTEFTKLLVPTSSSVSTRSWFEGMFTSLGDRSFNEELQEVTWALGAEYLYNNAFALRAGYFHESVVKGNRQYFTMGAGFTARAFTVNLSYLMNASDVNNPLENTLRFSLGFDLGEIFEEY